MMRWLYHGVRLFTAAWFIYAGFNFFLYPDNQRLGQVPASHDFTVALIDSGLFTWVKAAECVLGITLLFNRFMPLSVLALVPINFVVVYYNWVLEPARGTFIAGALTFLCTAYLAWSWRQYFWPLLTFRGEAQHSLRPQFSDVVIKGEKQV
ncbi:hypothetical protein GCM10009127_09800 [Alteraurantiacibacter aestuarii]|uniref:DoxX family protein n=1 Tax=Alteraurantiacibacter aestuarii TaxID=650004 RepID=A0A844ZNZ3_9SPHN|nr:hypothetical protein [Alteraurantiacibacter aestuarii]MXO87369.1 hypothetical protein [Alteraurantiacibacter aestuarii]